MFTGQNVLNALVLTMIVMWLGKRLLSVMKKKNPIITSEIQGSEGKITTYHINFNRVRWYVSQSETKWHLDNKFKKAPIWFSAEDGYPTLFIWKTALFYETNGMEEKRRNKK